MKQMNSQNCRKSTNHGSFSDEILHVVNLSGGKDNEKKYKMKSHLQEY